jgi:hypothetical protein
LSLVVKLEDDLGERSEWIILHGVLPSLDERGFPCLRCIGTYGKTVFNHLQMETFLEEWERVRGLPTTNRRIRPGRKLKTWPKRARPIVICI